MSRHRSLVVRIHCRIRRFVRSVRPIRVGQTSSGLVVAAALILLWGLEQPVAAGTVTGSSENQYFRLNWEYDLEAGAGGLQLLPKDIPGADRLYVDYAWFTTHGVRLWDGSHIRDNDWYGPEQVGTENGQSVYMYDRNGFYDLTDPVTSAASFCFMTFPKTGVTLVPGQLNLWGRVTALDGTGMSSIVASFEPLVMDFVTVQAIPEPGTIALMGVAAAVAGAVGKRRQEPDKDNMGDTQ